MLFLPKVPPQIAPFDFGDDAANVGEMAGVQCMATKGDLPIDIFWSLNEVPIVSGEQGFTVVRNNARTSALSMESLDGHHRGMYQCVARNKAGFFEIHAELRVNGANILLWCFPFCCFFIASCPDPRL